MEDSIKQDFGALVWEHYEQNTSDKLTICFAGVLDLNGELGKLGSWLLILLSRGKSSSNVLAGENFMIF